MLFICVSVFEVVLVAVCVNKVGMLLVPKICEVELGATFMEAVRFDDAVAYETPCIEDNEGVFGNVDVGTGRKGSSFHKLYNSVVFLPVTRFLDGKVVNIALYE